jgi:hypothetical protein
VKLEPNRLNAVVGGGIAGFLAGLIGTGGAIRGLALAAFDLEKSVFVATCLSAQRLFNVGILLARARPSIGRIYWLVCRKSCLEQNRAEKVPQNGARLTTLGRCINQLVRSI